MVWIEANQSGKTGLAEFFKILQKALAQALVIAYIHRSVRLNGPERDARKLNGIRPLRQNP
jgi:hypothetical protein